MLLLIALAIPVALTLLLSNRQVQAFAARKATEYLSGYTGAEMRIGSLSYSLFSDLTLKGIYVSDLHGDSLASINKIHTDVSILPIIFENKIRVKYLDIDSVDFKLESDSSGVLNLQFLIDAFTPDSIIEMPDLSFELRSCDITHATFSYTDTGGKKNKVGKLDPGNIEVRDIKTSFSIIHASKDSVALSIDSLSAYEKSGLRLQNFSLRGSLGKQGIELDEMDLKLPGSLISIDRLYMKYDSAAVIRTVEDLMYKARIGYVMNPSYIDWKDISCIVPQVAGLRNKAYVSAEAEMYNNSLNLKELRLKYGTGFNVECNASISDPLHVGNSFIYANVDKLHCSRREFENIFEDLGLEQIGVPETIYNLGDLDFNGNITGFVSNLVAYGQLHTLMGTVRTDIMLGIDITKRELAFNGRLSTEEFNLGGLFPSSNLGKLSLDISVDGNKKRDLNPVGRLSGAVKLIQFNGYDFRNMIVSGGYDGQSAALDLSFNDSNGNGSIDINATFDSYDNLNIATLDLDADSIDLQSMKLVDAAEGLKISAHSKAYVEFPDFDNIVGRAVTDSIVLAKEGEAYVLDSLVIRSDDMGKTKRLSVQSDLINAEVSGQYGFRTMANNLQYMVSEQLSNVGAILTHKMPSINDFSFEMTLAPLSDICFVIGSGWCVDDTTFISGYFNDSEEIVELMAYSGKIQNNTTEIDSLLLHVHNLDNRFHVAADARLGLLTDTTKFDLDIDLADNIIDLDFGWRDRTAPHFAGTWSSSLVFNKPKRAQDPVNLMLEIHPGMMVLGDSLWYVRKSNIMYDCERIVADNVLFESENQFVKINGTASRLQPDSVLRVDMRDFDLEYLSALVNMPDITLIGKATGYVSASHLFSGKPELNADVDVKQFGMNGYPMGDVEATAGFNHELQRIDMGAIVLNAAGDTSVAKGYVAPVEKEMLLEIDVNDINLQFIKPYMAVFADDMYGVASGKLGVGGKFDKITVWADAFVKDGMLSIDMLKSKFFFTDSVKMTKSSIIFDDITLYDEYGNKGSVSGEVNHTYFKNFNYRINLGVNNCQVMNTTSADLPEFYGRIFATGGAVIAGNEEKVDIIVNARPDAGSYFAVPISSYSSAADNKFISFIDKDAVKEEDEDARSRFQRLRRLARENNINTKVNVDLLIEATPDIEAQIIMDSHSGDIIKGRGSGNLTVNIDNNANVKIFGNYAISEGEYNFSLQGAIRKKFEVADGSSVSFDGDPMNGTLDINAMYQTTASLNDLLEEGMLTDVKSRVTKVNCLAHIYGNLQQPQVSFALELPNEDEEIQRRVNAMVNTDEMMLQQVVFLLLMNRFYNPQLAQNNGTNAANAWALSLATATISSQLNYWMSQISQNVNIGINYREDEQDASINRQFDVNISTNFFNNRLLIDGNVGYRNQYGSEDFIGDFNIEYKLNRSGRLRLKAYNQTNDRLYYNSLYTQGLGIMYREDFDTWNNLFKYYKEVFRKKTDEEKAAAKAEKALEKQEAAKRKAARKALREDRKRRHELYVAERKAKRQAEKLSGKKAKKDSTVVNRPPQVFYVN